MKFNILGCEITIIKAQVASDHCKEDDYNGCRGTSVGRGYGGDIAIN